MLCSNLHNRYVYVGVKVTIDPASTCTPVLSSVPIERRMIELIAYTVKTVIHFDSPIIHCNHSIPGDTTHAQNLNNRRVSLVKTKSLS